MLPGVPNVLRVVLAEPVAARPRAVVLIEANVDDMDPRVWPSVLEELIERGAQDAWLTPILMKKGRPAHQLSVLAPEHLAHELRQVVFAHTSTIGLRTIDVAKTELARWEATVEVEGAPVRVKVSHADGKVLTVQPEYDDVRAAARLLGRPVRAVLADARAAARAVGADRGVSPSWPR
ncbi:nickel insertion protein [Streptomyces sp. NPDC002586]